MVVTAEEVKRVADIPCPKCGSDDVSLYHFPFLGADYSEEHRRCRNEINVAGHTPEHFHRTCQRCHFRWPTFDVLPC